MSSTAHATSRRSLAALVAVVAVAIAAVAIALIATGGGSSRALFAPTSIWNARLAGGAALDPASPAIVGSLDREVQSELARRDGPWINTAQYSTPIYTVGAGQPTTRVQIDKPGAAALQAAMNAVPLPTGARPATGRDGELTVWQPSTDKLWEFWHLSRRADGWHADWGGAMGSVSGSPGVFTPSSWPGAQRWWGASATSLPLIAGTIRIAELRRGSIDHALALAIPHARASVYALPAQRTDGNSRDPASVPEGAHFRLDPKLDVDRLHLPPPVRAMAIAAQRYGIVVRDGSAVVSFYAEDPAPLGSDPYGELFEHRYPNNLLALFPWSHLQLLKMQLRHG